MLPLLSGSLNAYSKESRKQRSLKKSYGNNKKGNGRQYLVIINRIRLEKEVKTWKKHLTGGRNYNVIQIFLLNNILGFAVYKQYYHLFPAHCLAILFLHIGLYILRLVVMILY